MKSKLVFPFALIVVIVFFNACRQESNADIFSEFEGDEGIYMIKLPPALLLGMIESEAKSQGGPAGGSVDDFGDIDFVKVMMFDEDAAGNRNTDGLVAELKERFDRYGFEMALSFSGNGAEVSAFMLEDKDGSVSDIMVLVRNNEGLLGLGLSGSLDGKALLTFASGIDTRNLQDLTSFNGLGF